MQARPKQPILVGSWSSLRTGFETQPIMVLNRGVSGERAVDMLARFDESVSAERPDLVLWQVGTNAVLRGYEHSKSDRIDPRRYKANEGDRR